jgi:protein O-mannosyl-transferase
VLLALVTLAVFWPVAGHDFVDYDDGPFIFDNPHVTSGLKLQNLAWAFTTGHTGNWHPLTWMTHMLDCQCFGLKAGAHHLVNVALHAANTLLLFFGLWRLTGAHGRSAMAAALFALHPLRVESVAWAAERKDVLCACFGLLTLLLYARWAKQANSLQSRAGVQNLKSKILYGLALLCFALGLMSKPMLVTLPFVLLLIDFWPLQRLQPVAWGSVTVRLFEKGPFLLLSLIASGVAYRVQVHSGAVATSLSLYDRAANALVSCVRYLGKFFWPVNLSFFYPHPGHWPAGTVAGAAVLLLALSAAVLARARQRPYLPVGWLWYLGMLLPVIGLVQVGLLAMADRYTYLPMIGLAILLVWGAGDLVERWHWRPSWVAAAAMAPLAACAVLSVQQLQYWRNSRTLFEHATRVTSGNYLAYNNLGNYWYQQGRFDEAATAYRKSLETNPERDEVLNNLGLALARQGTIQEAMACFEAALRIQPDHEGVLRNLAEALRQSGTTDEATRQFIEAVKQSDAAAAHCNLGLALTRAGRFEEADVHLRLALRLKPDYADTQNNLGILLGLQGRLDDAMGHFLEAIRLEPSNTAARNNLAAALAARNRFPEAIEQYRQSLQLNPDDAGIHARLADMLAAQGRREEAVEHYREALRLNLDDAGLRKRLEEILPSDKAQ